MAEPGGVRTVFRKRFAPVFAALAVALVAGASPAQELHATARGQFARPGSYTLSGVAALSDLIRAAGGFTDNAWLKEAVLIRPKAREGQARRLASAVSTADSVLRRAKVSPARRERFLAFLSSLRPSGRIPVHLSLPRLLQGTKADFALADGDELFVPAGKGKVGVTGAVERAGMSALPPGREYGEYIHAAGGYTARADRRAVYLFTGEGTTVPLVSPWIRWNDKASRWEFSAFRRDRPRIEAGDTVVVPSRPSVSISKAAAGKLFAALREIARITGVFVDPP